MAKNPPTFDSILEELKPDVRQMQKFILDFNKKLERWVDLYLPWDYNNNIDLDKLNQKKLVSIANAIKPDKKIKKLSKKKLIKYIMNNI